jgi:uncharacterized protein (TIGR00288 family)
LSNTGGIGLPNQSSRAEHAARAPQSEEPLIAMFVDFENLAIGVRDMKAGKFQIQLIIKRLLEKGRIVYKRAYCDWSNYHDALREFHGQGIELIDIPQSKMSGKNSADIRMVVDALDLCYSKQHIDVFALISGDSDFSPLVSKLKENNKRVLGCGVKSSTSDLLIANCDEFLYYDDLIRVAKRTQSKAPPKKDGAPAKKDKKQEAFDRVLEVVHSIEPDYDPLWGSLLKQAIRRVFPGFNEGYYGYPSFSELLEDIQVKGLIKLEYDESRGNYKVSLPKDGGQGTADKEQGGAAEQSAEHEAEGTKRRHHAAKSKERSDEIAET